MPKVPGMRSGAAHRRPVCSAGHTRPPVKDSKGKWVCPDCFNEFVARETRNRTTGGVVLPTGVRGIDQDFFSKMFPNRRTRRS